MIELRYTVDAVSRSMEGVRVGLRVGVEGRVRLRRDTIVNRRSRPSHDS